MMAWTDQYGLYDGSWKGLIVDEAFAHPAKFARGLICWIIEHGLEKGYWKKGQLLADPFAGIGTGGIIAASNGLRWVGVELEPRFVELAEQNFEKHRRTWEGFGDPLPVIVQGDSREFARIVGECGAVVTSPPWSTQAHQGGDTPAARGIRADGTRHRPCTARGLHEPGGPARLYGQTPGQIGSLPAGSIEGVVTSPPFAGSDQPCASQTREKKDYHAFTRGDGTKRDHQMQTEGNIAALPAGRVEGVITSPPYAETVKGDHGETETATESREKRQTPGGSLGQSQRHGGYGVSEGQIGALKEGQVDAVVTSPPWEDQEPQQDKAFRMPHDSTGNARGAYGQTEGQIGRESAETYWRAVAEVYRQVYLALKPGGVLAVVVKMYVKDKKLVPLPDDTWKLLLSIGFEPVERTRAMLTKTEKHPSLFGGDVVKTTKRVSFFRRLAEAKGSPPIDWEDVLWVRKPASTAGPS